VRTTARPLITTYNRIFNQAEQQQRQRKMVAHLLIPERFRRQLALSECANPLASTCSACSPIEITLGTCGVLADSQLEANVGLVTAWGMFVCFLIPVVGVIVRRTRIIYAGLTPIIAIICAAVLQATIPSRRPVGACMGQGSSCGMPSGHVITSYATVAFLFLMWARDIKLKGARRCISELLSPFGIALSIVVGGFVVVQLLMPVGRVMIKYHTPEQVGLGVLVGTMIGTAWFIIVLKFVGLRLGPFLERKLAYFGFQDDWSRVGIKAEFAVRAPSASIEPLVEDSSAVQLDRVV